MTSIIGPPGWRQDQLLRRFDSSAALAPLTYDAGARTVHAVLSVGSPVQRVYGTEKLRISAASIDLGRVRSGSAPLLDSHQGNSIKHVLGRVQSAWIDQGALMGRLGFAETEQGELAMGMVARGEINAVSLGYAVREWEITDENDDVLDPDKTHIRWDANLTFTATLWELLEGSLVSVSADAQAFIRTLGRYGIQNGEIDDIRERVLTRQRMHDLEQATFHGERLQ